jgi:hypothetical protein
MTRLAIIAKIAKLKALIALLTSLLALLHPTFGIGSGPVSISTPSSTTSYAIQDELGTQESITLNQSSLAVTFPRWNGLDGVEITPLGSYAMTESLATSSATSTAFNFDFTIPSLPATSTFSFAVSSSPDVSFFYQPPLWQDFGFAASTSTCTDTTCTIGSSTYNRPTNVVGSYAVYSIAHRNNRPGQPNFATGKLFHIYRPQATDASGTTAWATMNISSGTLTVTIPQSFLVSAKYPVTVDPTFGYTTAGATQGTSGSDFGIIGDQGTSPSAGTVTSLSYYTDSSSGSCTARGTMYDNGGNNNLLDYSATSSFSGAAAWQTGTSNNSYVFTSATDTWIGFEGHSSPCPGNEGYFYDTGSLSWIFNSTYSDPPPNPFVKTTTHGSAILSAYVTYSTGGGATTPTEVILGSGVTEGTTLSE